MKINEVTRQSTVRAPSASIRLGGNPVAGLLEFTVNQNSRYQANSFNLTLSIRAAEGAYAWPDWATITLDRDYNVYSTKTTDANQLLPVEIELEQDDKTTLLFSGIVDEFDFDPVAGTIYLRGRDKTALFIEKKTQQKFLELTVSELVRSLALDAGLKEEDLSIADDPTAIGTAYQDQAISTTTTRTYWDLMTSAAQDSGYWIYFEGNKLIYTPDPTVVSNESPSDDEKLTRDMHTWLNGREYELRFDRDNPDRPWSNAVSVSFRRALTVSRDVFVDVRTSDTWDASHRVTARASMGTRPQTRGGAAQVFSYQLQGKTPEQARQFADRKLRQITAQQVALSATLPGTPDLNEATAIAVTGTDTQFDQTYYIDNLSHQYSTQTGYRTTLRAKNHSTETTVFR